MRVLDKLNTFEGRSQFTTWVYKIAVRIALNELRGRKWRDVSLEEMTTREESDYEPSWTASNEPTPEARVTQQDAMQRVRRIIKEELSDKQRMALMAVGANGVPLEEVAQRMGTNRNALYKLIHDARLRLKKRLEVEGLSAPELLSMFEK